MTLASRRGRWKPARHCTTRYTLVSVRLLLRIASLKCTCPPSKVSVLNFRRRGICQVKRPEYWLVKLSAVKVLGFSRVLLLETVNNGASETPARFHIIVGWI